MTKPIIYLAAGGTGGHLFPAIALSRALQKKSFKTVILTDARAKKYASQTDGIDLQLLASGSIFSGGKTNKLLAPLKILLGVLQAMIILISNRPVAVIGFGGYPSFPPLLAARLLFCKIAIHEQNAVLGRANRMLSLLGARITASYPGTRHVPASSRGSMVVTGNPVRPEVLRYKDYVYSRHNVNGTFNLLVFGGSQGASVFSTLLPEAISLIPREKLSRLKLVQQCRKGELASTLQAYGALGIDVELRDFFDDMPLRIVKAHLVISRSGASSISEMAVIGCPSLLVPLPQSIDQDQKINALQLSNHEAAWVVDQKNLTPIKLAEMISEFMESPHKLEVAARAAKTRAIPQATENLVKFVETYAGYRDGAKISGDAA
jgi:UDP-N-acetylglucosamine--N-acetylmuramyl-(pentapeptide) pyrophosphoryl-undecaprenol N-acetylglucosamine transferase